MKIEKINENQIRCILSSADLSERQIDLNELAYGSGKARQLFHEMIEKAFHDLDFDVEDSPLMVEAIPLPMNSIMLIISKIEDSEEMDSRYSRFVPVLEEDILGDLMSIPVQILEGAAAAIHKQLGQAPAEPETPSTPEPEQTTGNTDTLRIFGFSTLQELAHATSFVQDAIHSCSSVLYRMEDGTYHLVLIPTNDTDPHYSRICNVMAEFGTKIPGGLPAASYHEEHCEKLLARNALSVVAKLY